MSRNKFPHDQDNRIQQLYYDVNINTIFNRTKLQNVKNKFWKYLTYLLKYEQNNIQPKLIELQKIRDGLYIQLQQAKRNAYFQNPIHESHKKRDLWIPIFSEADDNYEEMKCEQYFYDEVICDIQDKIQDINIHQKNIKHYRKCAHCEKMDMVTISGCKSKHKLCSECIYDKTECPVCNEDLGLQHCDICYEYKKVLVDTGCNNKHQTCKCCLEQIKKKNNLCPFCRGCCSKEPPVRTYVEGTYHTVEEMEQGHRPSMSDADAMRGADEIENARYRRYGRYYWRDAEEDEEDRRENIRDSMRERARDSMRG